MVWWLRSHSAVPEDLSSVPSAHFRWLTVTVDTCIRLHSYTPPHMYAIKNKKILKNQNPRLKTGGNEENHPP